MIGRVFERLTVIAESKSKNHRKMYLCRCCCKTELIVSGHSLRSGNTKSCGCLAREILSQTIKNNKKYNIYFDVDDETMGAYAHNTNVIFYFDKNDFEKIEKYCWRSEKNYIKTSINRKAIFLHRLIMNYPNEDIDHIDRNPLNNKKNNLRIATHGENARNAKIRKDNSGSIIKGVTYNKINKNWRAILNFNKRRVLDKSFNNFVDAVICRLKAEKECFDNFAPQKELFDEFGI